jgi:hypothetical protein
MDVTGAGRQVRQGREEQPEIFNQADMMAIHGTGKTADRVAEGLGYKNWAEYEKKAATIVNDERNIPKWRRSRRG